MAAFELVSKNDRPRYVKHPVEKSEVEHAETEYEEELSDGDRSSVFSRMSDVSVHLIHLSYWLFSSNIFSKNFCLGQLLYISDDVKSTIHQIYLQFIERLNRGLESENINVFE